MLSQQQPLQEALPALVQIAAHRIGSQRQRQARGLPRPPLAQIRHQREAVVTVGQLPFVDEQACLEPSPSRTCSMISSNATSS